MILVILAYDCLAVLLWACDVTLHHGLRQSTLLSDEDEFRRDKEVYIPHSREVRT